MKTIDWYNRGQEFEFRDMGLHWFVNGNGGTSLERNSWMKARPEVKDFWDESPDSSYHFERNLKVLPEKWRFRKDTVGYEFNSEGFRTTEFDKVDWQNSYVILGCSYVFGIGVPQRETIGHYIEQQLGKPVINLGVGGASVTAIYNNLVKLLTDFGKPKGVIILWTWPHRKTNIISYNVYDDKSYSDFWRREDIVPGDSTSYKSKQDFDNKYMSEQYYQRSLLHASAELLLNNTPYANIDTPVCWLMDTHVKTHGFMFKNGSPDVVVPTPKKYKEHLQNLQKGFPGIWKKIPIDAKEWYLNNICARDIQKVTNGGPDGFHWGPAVNRAVADKLVFRLKNDASVKRIKL